MALLWMAGLSVAMVMSLANNPLAMGQFRARRLSSRERRRASKRSVVDVAGDLAPAHTRATPGRSRPVRVARPAAGGLAELLVGDWPATRRNVEELIVAILRMGRYTEVIVVDDGSRDGTAHLVKPGSEPGSGGPLHRLSAQSRQAERRVHRFF